MSTQECRYCQKPLPVGAQYCAQCGGKVEGAVLDAQFQSRDDVLSGSSSFEEVSEESLKKGARSGSRAREAKRKSHHQSGSEGRRTMAWFHLYPILAILVLGLGIFMPGFFGRTSFYQLVTNFSGRIEESALALNQAQGVEGLTEAELASLAVVEQFTQVISIVLYVALAFLALSLILNLFGRPVLAFFASLISVAALLADLGVFYYLYQSLSQGLGDSLTFIKESVGFNGLEPAHYILGGGLLALLVCSWLPLFSRRRPQ